MNDIRKFDPKKLAEEYINSPHQYTAAATPRVIELSKDSGFMTEFFEVLISGFSQDPDAEEKSYKFFTKYDLLDELDVR